MKKRHPVANHHLDRPLALLLASPHPRPPGERGAKRQQRPAAHAGSASPRCDTFLTLLLRGCSPNWRFPCAQCDGERPKCAICRDRGTVCEFDTNAAETHTQALKRKYSELQSQKTAFEQIYDVLQTRTDKEAEEVFQRIRRGADVGSILRHVNYGDVLVQLALVPEARYRYEFPYLSDMPQFLRRPDNPYLDSEVYECALRGSRDPAHTQPQQHPLPPNAGNEGSSSASVYWRGQRDPYLKPYLSATVVHPWLGSVKPSRWTTVSSDDGLMRKLVHDYLLFEYDWFTFFHKDYFLEDMAAERPRFCSELLVNAVLCVGCVSHRRLSGCCPLTVSPSSAIGDSEVVPSSGIRKTSGTSFLPSLRGSLRSSPNSRSRCGLQMTHPGNADRMSGSSDG